MKLFYEPLGSGLYLVPSSILMAYTLALANSYGCLISELKRQIEKVSQAGSLGTWGREPVSPLPLFTFISGGAEQSLPGTARRGAELGQRGPLTSPAWGLVVVAHFQTQICPKPL